MEDTVGTSIPIDAYVLLAVRVRIKDVVKFPVFEVSGRISYPAIAILITAAKLHK